MFKILFNTPVNIALQCTWKPCCVCGRKGGFARITNIICKYVILYWEWKIVGIPQSCCFVPWHHWQSLKLSSPVTFFVESSRLLLCRIARLVDKGPTIWLQHCPVWKFLHHSTGPSSPLYSQSLYQNSRLSGRMRTLVNKSPRNHASGHFPKPTHILHRLGTKQKVSKSQKWNKTWHSNDF